MQIVISANAEALTQLCGVSLLERLLRILKRLDFDRATIICDTPEEIRAAIEPPTWAREKLVAEVVRRSEFRNAGRTLFVPGNIYCDARLLRGLVEHGGEVALVDSGFISGAGVIEDGEFASIPARVRNGEIAILDATHAPSYVVGMRRHVRPRCFAVAPNDREAMRVVLDASQAGSLDFPALVHAPIEKFLARGLCRTAIRPNQITVISVLVSLGAAALFVTGHLGLGLCVALAVGIIDGLDGKQARIKIETTAAGEWEHIFDYITEAAWWAALAFCFHDWSSFVVIMATDAVDRLAKRDARLRIGRLLDDYTPFDRFVRLIGARRNVYIWLLTVGYLFGMATALYRFCAILAALTALVHVVRAIMIRAK